ncbi:MAG: GNAT family N-acetyltransferase [Planctomycetes bacterium]|nr:GNAT family N-acetyltransferase [Planctomycetota bacterium]
MDRPPEPEAADSPGSGVGEQVLAPRCRPAVPAARGGAAAAAPAPVYGIEIVDSTAAIDRFEDFHREHHAHPESHFDLVRAAMQNGRTALPFFVMVSRDGAPCLLLVAQVARGRLPWRLGYRTIHSSRACTIEVLQGGWLGDCSPPCLEFLCDQLYEVLRRGGADAIHLRHVPAGSDVHRIFARRPPWPWRDRVPAKSRNWKLSLPASYAAWLQAQPKREREDNKRYDKRIRKEFGARVRVELIDAGSDVDRAAALLEGIARKTYQRGIGAGFRDSADARSRWRAAALQDALDVRVLWLDDQPVAFTVGFLFDGTLWLEHLGYDPALRRFRPGMFLLHRTIEELASRGNVHTIDFGIGDADYKRRVCDRSREDVSIYLFAPTLRGLWLSSMRSAANLIGRAGVACLHRLGLLPWFKSRWRRALQPRELGPDGV